MSNEKDWKANWERTKERFGAWWKGDLTESPLVCLPIMKKNPEPPEAVPGNDDPRRRRTDPDVALANFRNYLRAYDFAADSYPGFDADFGPGSLALYLGCEPVFAEDTVWYRECVSDSWENRPIAFDENNPWWRLHYQMVKKAAEMSGGDYLVNIPDLIENVDTLASMRGTTNTCYDLIDEPELMKRRLSELDEVYFRYYDRLYDAVKDENGGSSFAAFQVWGPGRTAKVQCDFSALMSPEQYREFIVPSLTKQCGRLDFSIYHLDGPGAVKHLGALMEIEPLRALQWTAGNGQPDGADEKWYFIYDKVMEAGKSLWIHVGEGSAGELVEKARRLVRRYGVRATYLLFPHVDAETGEEILKAAAKGFR
ncbi:MAG: trimethylamine corrinoid protein 2 [Firmicutes bacterium]|nr:trimethylamine corrinoid protein 2 [Bacillota bacterium]